MSQDIKLCEFAMDNENIADKQDLIVCPLNPAHICQYGSLQFHLVKCISDFKGKRNILKICPFDRTHIVKVQELIQHVKNCPSRGVFDRYKYRMGATPVNISIPAPPMIGNVEESWDSLEVPTYDKEKALEGRFILRKSVGAKPSEKRQMKMEQRRKFNQL